MEVIAPAIRRTRPERGPGERTRSCGRNHSHPHPKPCPTPPPEPRNASFDRLSGVYLRRLDIARIAVLTTLLAVAASASARPTMSIATGGPAGLYYPFGGAMASIWSKSLPNVNVKAEVTGGSLTNVIQVARHESDLGIAMADIVTDAYRGAGRFPAPLPIRVLFAAYPNIVHILTLADSGIERVADLRGRRVSLGAAGSGTAIAAENVLEGLGVPLTELSDQYLNFGGTTAALKDGTIDAGFVVGGLGIAAVTELSVTRDLHLVALSPDEIEQLAEQFPAYSGFRIPPDTYNGVGAEVAALGIWSVVVVRESMPADLAYALTCTIYENQQRLLQVTAVASATTRENAGRLAAVPLHAGAQAYLDAARDTGTAACPAPVALRP